MLVKHRSEGMMAHQTLGQEVAERLRSDLTGGVFKPGEKLPPERELMTRYNAGRNTVREAVQGLVALGMLEVKAGYGTTVSRADGRIAIARSVADRPLDEAALADLVEFRLLLEGAAASLAAQRASAEDLALLREKLAAYQDAVRRSEEVYAHDVAFHRAVSAGTHNSFYLEVIDMSSQLFQGAMRAADRTPGDLLKAAEEHAMIAHHVALGDADAAGKAMRAHILAGNERRLIGSPQPLPEDE
jgi:GntR family transcriptional regulator, transcriptional repressor for pyruvate dehydrogenase complex